MKTLFIAVASLICALGLSSCGRGAVGSKPISGPPQAGALYSFNDGEGGFRTGKVIVVEDDIIFVRYYGDRWKARPSLAEAGKAGKAIFLAFSAETFAGMQPVHLEYGTVLAEESAEYETWKQSKQDVF